MAHFVLPIRPVRALFLTLLLVGAAAVVPPAAARQGTAGRGAGDAAGNEATVSYEIGLDAPADGTIPVTIRVDRFAGASFDLVMPVWVERYREQHFGRRVSELAAATADGVLLRVDRIGPEQWRVASEGYDAVEVTYLYHASDDGPDGVHLDARHASILPGVLLAEVPQITAGPVSLRFRAPTAWKVATTLEPSFDPNLFRAATFEELARTPLELSNHRERFFAIQSMNAQIVLDRMPQGFDERGFSQAFETVANRAVDLFGVVPASDYLVVVHFEPFGERRTASFPGASVVSWSDYSADEGLDGLLHATLGAFLRSWLGGRIRSTPMAEAGHRELFTTDTLWFTEGAADYYADLLMSRSGVRDPGAFLARMAARIARVQNSPARTVQSAAAASSEVWFREEAAYRDPQRSIDYRDKGCLLLFLLDLDLRGRTGGVRSLDDVMAFMGTWYGRTGRSFDDSAELMQLASALGRVELGSFYEDLVIGTEELPFRQDLAFAGWQLVPATEQAASAGFAWDPRGDGSAIVTGVEERATAFRAGLRTGDRILTVDAWRTPAALYEIVAGLPAGTRLALHIRRGADELDITFPLGEETRQVWRIESLPTLTAQQEAVRAGLLGGR